MGTEKGQKPVVPNFSMDECRKMLEDYTGGHDTFPVAQEIADRFAKKIIAREKEFKVESTATVEQRVYGDADTHFSLRVEEPPKKTIKAYKVFVAFESDPGHLYPPMVASPGGSLYACGSMGKCGHR